MKKTFLKAEWRKLLMANYQIDPQVLMPYLPHGTELDLWNNTCYVSLIGFLFLKTRVKGIAVPFHSDFEEVNLRFYVKHLENGVYKRGVVFLKEIVPKPAITFVANTLYGEKYETRPMRHSWQTQPDSQTVEYAWKQKEWHSLSASADLRSYPITVGSEEEFITEHFWGYTRINANTTSMYEVAHPRWEVYPVQDYAINVDFRAVYGPEFAFLGQAVPRSVFLAEGSEILVMDGGKLQGL
ncbi:hypothetical protein TH63_16060 [Rufibacter radiotolerans]|uniref:DUF2071 domain-containing protein n=1 Tax=Rufibacter radiotolerans TaxID=1379910 RepID=A0A0H4VNA9_9BACT|nr:DUF2071 domain-containing protein [Rufibacter radiotolerans]AKQ46798.1 hypothetical protein TH63_16060 [Rufibacter radiotolerans]